MLNLEQKAIIEERKRNAKKRLSANKQPLQTGVSAQNPQLHHDSFGEERGISERHRVKNSVVDEVMNCGKDRVSETESEEDDSQHHLGFKRNPLLLRFQCDDPLWQSEREDAGANLFGA